MGLPPLPLPSELLFLLRLLPKPLLSGVVNGSLVELGELLAEEFGTASAPSWGRTPVPMRRGAKPHVLLLLLLLLLLLRTEVTVGVVPSLSSLLGL